MPDFSTLEYFAVAFTGFIAGTLGGMLGVGGSLIMIPALVILFGQDARKGMNQHLYQAAAMIVNVTVAAPATWRHQQAGAIVPRVLRWMLPSAMIFILAGVWASNLDFFADENGVILLARVMAVFIAYVVVMNIRKLLMAKSQTEDPLVLRHITPTRCLLVGAAMGFVAGLLGIGGGAVAVPLQQVILKLRLRNCIANSAAVMCLSAIIGAIYKNVSLSQHNLIWQKSITIAALLAPTAIIGGLLGGRLTHIMPLKIIRTAFILLLTVAAIKMANLF